MAVAWATVDFEVFRLLVKNKKKIKKMIVGTHFYQTAPEFIETFLAHPNVRFILPTGGESVFHPKIYVFEMNDQE